MLQSASKPSRQPFSIKIEYGPPALELWTSQQRASFERAKDRWMKAIRHGGLRPAGSPDVTVAIEKGALPKGYYAQAKATLVWPATQLPKRAQIMIDRASLAQLDSGDWLENLMIHEMGHCIGFGLNWPSKLIRKSAAGQAEFRGPQALKEYLELVAPGRRPQITGVPLEDEGSSSQASVHWDEKAFGSELMSRDFGPGPTPLSRVTLASFADIGYEVEWSKADVYALPQP